MTVPNWGETTVFRRTSSWITCTSLCYVKSKFVNIKCLSAVPSEGMHTFCFIYRRCSRINKALRIQPTGWDMIKPRLWLRYHEAPALTLRSRQAAGLIRGEDAIVPCLIIPQRASRPWTRFLFRQRGCFLAENWETLLCPFRSEFWNGFLS